jgi:hypothetical protein
VLRLDLRYAMEQRDGDLLVQVHVSGDLIDIRALVMSVYDTHIMALACYHMSHVAAQLYDLEVHFI